MEKHAENGHAKRLETFIGGMTDGRGGYINGKSVREGNPKVLLEEFKAKYPKKRFVFSRDDSGQFQTYFSIWALTPKPIRKPVSKAKTKAKRKAA